MKNFLSKALERESVGPKVEETFKRFDVDGDDTLDKTEATLLVREMLENKKAVHKQRNMIFLLFIAIVLMGVTNIGTAYLAVSLAKDTYLSENDIGEAVLTEKNGGRRVATVSQGVTVEVDMSQVDVGLRHFCVDVKDIAKLWHSAETGSETGVISKMENGFEEIIHLHGATKHASEVCFPTLNNQEIFCVDMTSDRCSDSNDRRLMEKVNSHTSSGMVRSWLFEKHRQELRGKETLKGTKEKKVYPQVFKNDLDDSRFLKESNVEDFLEWLSLFAGGLMAAGTFKTASNIPLEVDLSDVYDTVIIGAGWAGLGAATRLLRQKPDMKLLILEANDYVGGRSKSEYFDTEDGKKIPVDLGSEWILFYDGCEEERLYEQMLDTRDQCPDEDGVLNTFGVYEPSFDMYSTFKEGEGKVTEGEMKENFSDLWDGFLSFASKQKARTRFGNDKSFEEVLKNYEKKEKTTPEQNNFLDSLERSEVEIEFGAGSGKVSIKNGLFLEKENDLHLGGSFGVFAKRYAQCRKIDEFVQLNSAVTRISYDGDKSAPVTITYAHNRHIVKELKTKTVIVTVPLGVLKRKKITFHPQLPQKKRDAIEAIGFGKYSKWIGYWNKNVLVPWDNQEDSKWNILVQDGSNNTAAFISFNNQFSSNGGHKVMAGHIGGDQAEELSMKSDVEVHESAMSSLKNMYGEDVPTPNDYKVVHWTNKENFWGSYSFPKTNENFGRHSKDLAEPVASKLFFAGEACAGDWYGTTTGAYNSGLAVGGKIIYELSNFGRRKLRG